MDEWKELEIEYYKNNPYGNAYWKKEAFFKACPCPWMAGSEMVRGKKLMYNGKVLDSSIPGELILVYKIHRE